MGSEGVEVPRDENTVTTYSSWAHPPVSCRGSAGTGALGPNVRVLLPAGVRQLDPKEWIKLKGLPKGWRPGAKALRNIVESPGAHEWGALGDFLSHL